MLEVIRRVVSHSNFLHHPARSAVCRDGERNNLFDPQCIERIAKNLAGTFGRQADSPVIGGEPPANLDGGHKGGIETRHGKPHKPDKGPGRSKLCCKKTKVMLFEMPFDAVQQFVARFSLKRSGHELHHSSIRVQLREGLTIRFSPSPQDKSLCLKVARHFAWNRETEKPFLLPYRPCVERKPSSSL